ncbi:MAG TPA: hypothetical protein VGC70_15365 [Burkholderiales bacterium]
MAVNPVNEERPEDVRLAALYREAAVETPPERLDRLIQDRARRPEQPLTRAKQESWWSPWRTPFVAAAVAVVSASLVVVMMEKGGERAALSPAKPAADAREGSATRAEREPTLLSGGPNPSEPLANRRLEPLPKAEQSAGRSPRSSAARLPAEPKPVEPAGPDTASADARVLSPQRPKFPAAADENQHSGMAERDASPAPAPPFAVPAPVLSPRRVPAETAQEPKTATPSPKPAPSNNALASRRMEAARVPPSSSSPAAGLISELEGEPPARWIDRIITLRRDGRRQEAEALLVEFKLRYPSEPLPARLQRDDD